MGLEGGYHERPGSLWVLLDCSQAKQGRMDLSKAPTRFAAAHVARSEMAACLHRLDGRTKCEPLCQFCVSWHTLSWSVLAEMAEMAETGNQTKT